MALIAERAGPGAVDCGAAGVWWDDLPPAPARACALDAMAAGAPFFVTIDEGVFDGRLTVGFASDGTTFTKLDYEAAYGMFPGTDSEELRWEACAWLESRGVDCPTLTRDLCLACVGATPIM